MMAAVNAAVCVAVAWCCVCRLNATTGAVLPAVRGHLACLLAAALASAAGPVFGEPVTWGQLLMAVCALVGLLLSMQRWSGGPPREIVREPRA